MNRSIIITGIMLMILGAALAQDIERVKEINTGPNGSAYPHDLVIANNKLFFIATDNVNYTKLWVTEGTDATTLFLGPATGVIGSISNLVSFKDKVYFSYDNGSTGLELWVSDGTVAGTVLFKDLYLGSTGSYPHFFTVANNKLFFMADAVDGPRRLYVSDGTVAGTVIIKNSAIDIFNGLNAFAILNNDIYFRGDDGTGSGSGLWKSNGSGAVLVKKDIVPGTTGCNTVVLNNRLYFTSFDFTYGSELWSTDGTGPGTNIVKNLAPDGGGVYGSGAPPNLIVYNSKIYFVGKDDINGPELWVTDGTGTGTKMVKDIYPGVNGSQPYKMIVYNGLLYMICSLTQELWKSDGTDIGTTFVKAIAPYSKFSAVWNGKMYITNDSYDNIVWESDGTATGTKPLVVQNTINTIYSLGPDLTFTEYNAELYFSGYCYIISLAYELCKLKSGTAVKAFSFTGNGNWSNPANWSGGVLPPANLPAGYSITINGNCILDITQRLLTGSSLTVAAGKSLVILGSLNIL